MRRGVLPYVRFGGLIVCTGLLVWAVDWREAASLLRTADPLWLLSALLLLTVQTVLSAQRWRITAAELGISIAPATALREYYLGQVVNQSLPGGVLGDASRAVRARQAAGLVASSQAVVFERLAGQLGLVALLSGGCLIAVFAPLAEGWPDWFVRLLVVVPVVAAAISLVGWAVSRRAWRTRARVWGWTAPFLRAVAGPGVWHQQVALSLGTAACNVLAFACCAFALGVDLPILAAVVVIPLVLFAMVLPLSVGGWGVREGAAAALFPVIGVTAAQGLATSVAFGLVLLVSVLPGLVLGGKSGAAPVARPLGATGLHNGGEP